jgi:aryl-alcohol dehydrogenase-like predicted oxidoreductase
LTTHREEAEAVAILERAFALGITHFDVARAYGFGRAEGILGKFLRGRRNRVTVATKLGLQPPAGIAGNARIINAAKRLLTPFPALLKLAKRGGSAMEKSAVFAPEAAIRSLEASLRELGSDYVDILLLHEATLADAASEGLLDALQRQVAKGSIRHLGIASEFSKLQHDAARLAAAYEIVQFNDNAWRRNLPTLQNREHRLLITHSIFEPAARLSEAARVHADLAAESSRRIGADLSDPDAIAALLLHYALRSNAGGVVLFSSTNPRHLETNVREAQGQRFGDAQLDHFVAYVDQALGTSGAKGMIAAAEGAA